MERANTMQSVLTDIVAETQKESFSVVRQSMRTDARTGKKKKKVRNDKRKLYKRYLFYSNDSIP